MKIQIVAEQEMHQVGRHFDNKYKELYRMIVTLQPMNGNGNENVIKVDDLDEKEAKSMYSSVNSVFGPKKFPKKNNFWVSQRMVKNGSGKFMIYIKKKNHAEDSPNFIHAFDPDLK